MALADKREKTEKPTPKRRSEARKRGQVPRSPDIGTFILLFVGSFVLPMIVSMARTKVLGVFSQMLQVIAAPTVPGAMAVLESGMIATVEVVLPVASGFMVLGIATSLAQTGLGFSTQAMKPQLSRISPKAGFKRLFSAQNGVSLAKQLAKLTVLSGIGYASIHSMLTAVPASTPVELISTVGIGSSRILDYVRAVAGIGIVLGAADYLYQRKHLTDSLKMTKQEVKDEAKDRDGDPAMRNEIRKRAYRIARSRTLRAVTTADVVVANPTHFSVALRYDRSRSPAPMVVAKGSDDLALRMREIAAASEVPVVEDPPLARYLFATTEVGQTVPVEIYLAVARLLAFVFSLPQTFRGVAVRSYPHSSVPTIPTNEPAARSLDTVLEGAAAR
jgi:flagellar biosynthesis protein FlhB